MRAEAQRGDELTAATRAERLGAYRLVHRIGEGGMGVVYLGLDRQGRAVAIKVLRPHIAHDAGARARLEREVETLSRVRDRRVAAVIDADIHGERPYLVTRYVAGPSLDEVVGANGPLQGQALLDLGRGLVGTLEAIHRVGVIHRDLKPGNVLIDDEGEPVVIDFGIAHIADDVRLTSAGLVMGTPGYLSPEVIEGAPVTEATDWWGWAATLAFAATGRPPFGRGPMDVVLDRVRRGSCDLSQVDPRLAPLLCAALAVTPEQRPPASQVVTALERYAAGGPATVVLPAVPGSESSRGWEETSRHTSVLPAGEGAHGEWAQGEWAQGEWAGGTGWVDDEDDSDWQAAWDAGPGEPDPRIGRSARTGTLVAMLALAVALAAVAPAVAFLVLVLWSWLARFADRTVTSLVLRRYDRGRRRSDVLIAVALSPWHVVMAALSTVLSLLLPVVVAVGAMFSAALVVTTVAGSAGAFGAQGESSTAPVSPLTLAVGFLVGALVVWWGPGGASLRRGSRSLVRGVVRPGISSDVVVAALSTVAAGLGVWALLRTGDPTWWPLAGIPALRLGG